MKLDANEILTPYVHSFDVLKTLEQPRAMEKTFFVVNFDAFLVLFMNNIDVFMCIRPILMTLISFSCQSNIFFRNPTHRGYSIPRGMDHA